MITREGVLLRRLALIEAPRTLVDYEFLCFTSAVHWIRLPLAYLYPAPIEDSADVTWLLLEEAGQVSLIPLLSCLEEERHQVRQTFVTGGENIQNRPLDLALLILALSSLEHLTLVQPARSPEGCPEEGHAYSGLKDTRPLRVGSVRIDNSLSAINEVLSPPA